MFPFGNSRMEHITTEELRQRLENGEKLTIVDVREPWEFDEGHVKGSLLRPLGQIRQWAKEFDKDQELILICRTASRSAFAYKNLQAMGFTNLKNVAGGIITWRGEVERGGVEAAQASR